MLYYLHEMQRAAITPMRVMAEALQQVYTHPWVPAAYTGFGRAVAAGCEILERSTRRYPKPQWGLHQTLIDGKTVPIEIETVWDKNPFCHLLRFKRDLPRKRKDPKILMLAPLSGHYSTLLRGTVEAMLPNHDVYIADWIDASSVPLSMGHFDLDDYVDMVIDLLRFLGPETHLIAVCQPSVPAMAAVALMAGMNDPCQPCSMTLMGGPIDTRHNMTQPNKLAQSRSLSWFERNVVHIVPINHPGHGRRVYPGFLQLSGFMAMNLDRHVDAHVKLFNHMIQGDGDGVTEHKTFYDEYLSVMDLPAEYYLQTIHTVFQEHLLPKREWVSRGRLVDTAQIRRTALMTVEGEKDDISAVGQTWAAHLICENIPPEMHHHRLQEKVGHYGIFNGRRWREEILPDVADFIRRHDRVLA
ncbi:MAG: polyhydroxyalkanoate depolymerase [Rhodospirillales bacterium]|nr:polyhydroxyalkanoate depolymerase [Rhodospirillales bacterium]